jgi:hypothetical protein
MSRMHIRKKVAQIRNTATTKLSDYINTKRYSLTTKQLKQIYWIFY